MGELKLDLNFWRRWFRVDEDKNKAPSANEMLMVNSATATSVGTYPTSKERRPH